MANKISNLEIISVEDEPIPERITRIKTADGRCKKKIVYKTKKTKNRT